jgi:hypothetical protein
MWEKSSCSKIWLPELVQSFEHKALMQLHPSGLQERLMRPQATVRKL